MTDVASDVGLRGYDRGQMSFTDFDGANVVRSCTRKKVYPTEAVARLSVASIKRASPGADVRAYGCRNCGFWHVGGTPGVARQVAPGAETRRPPSARSERVRSGDSYRRARRRRSYDDDDRDDGEEYS